MSNSQNVCDLSRDELVSLVLSKNKCIRELQTLVEEQKRLRLQDSSQVEEKAAQIKEWVTNKLKDLENQNKQLRDQNKKQKEAIEVLSNKLAALNSISSPRRKQDAIAQPHSGSVPQSPIETIDVNRSLKLRRPQLKKQTVSSSSSSFEVDPSQPASQSSLLITLNSPSKSVRTPSRLIENKNGAKLNGGEVSYISIGVDHDQNSNLISNSNSNTITINNKPQARQESPLYDSVNIELVNSNNNMRNDKTTSHGTECDNKKFAQPESTLQKQQQQQQQHHYDQSNVVEVSSSSQPPPLPPHQTDRWELQLYSLAEQTFSSLLQDDESAGPLDKKRESGHRLNSLDSFASGSDKDVSLSRKSSSSLKNDIISLVRPSFTTIDGSQVVDNLVRPEQEPSTQRSSLHNNSLDRTDSNGQLRRDSNEQQHSSLNNSNHIASHHQNDFNTISSSNKLFDGDSHQKIFTQNVFDSPMRSRSGKDSILRTQSVRRNPAPERLYDFISADLVKRGYLVKHGALRNHTRWFVLKNFHLYSYKRDSEEAAKTAPTLTLKLEPTFQVQATSSSSDGYQFKLTSNENKTLILIAPSAQTRDEWIKILTVAINLSDIEPDTLTRNNSNYEGILNVTRHGHTKKCHAILVSHVMIFLKSPIDPTPTGYLSVKESRIREITDSYDDDFSLDEQEVAKLRGEPGSQVDCSLAIYPKYSLNLDPIYLTFGNQQDTDGWFYNLSIASGVDQSYGTEFERTLAHLMIENSIVSRKCLPGFMSADHGGGCLWRDHPYMMHSDKPIARPLTSLHNETLKTEALELFRSILLFTQAPIEPVAIDYHASLLQTCLGRLLKYPELRNEFFAQLIKQSTYIVHKCFGHSKLSCSGSSGCSSINQRSSFGSLSPSSSESCQFVTDLQQLDQLPVTNNRHTRYDLAGVAPDQHNSNHQHHQGGGGGSRDKDESSPQPEETSPPTRSELLQVMQMLSVAVPLNLPRGRLRCWLIDHLRKFANPETSIGKYALFTMKSIERSLANGPRENVPSRMEIMSILQRNPYDHSAPHSLPVSFADGSYLVVGADGSTTIEEFMTSMSKSVNIRNSLESDFYLFADDPVDPRELHILEPQRKVMDVVGWWEQACKQSNSGRHQNSRVIKLICRKRLIFRPEEEETDQERLLIVHQLNQEIASNKIPLNEQLIVQLATIMTQLTFGDYVKASRSSDRIRTIVDKISSSFLPNCQGENLSSKVMDQWQNISGKSTQDCIRVYLNCIRRLKLGL